mmetsp:Transcript_20976/g.74014  ORF Transcript_20976/g.74014 Transcript_20976/m.74014 type:complete len:410 (+) Transcript_20976:540-1769(+)
MRDLRLPAPSSTRPMNGSRSASMLCLSVTFAIPSITSSSALASADSAHAAASAAVRMCSWCSAMAEYRRTSSALCSSFARASSVLATKPSTVPPSAMSACSVSAAPSSLNCAAASGANCIRRIMAPEAKPWPSTLLARATSSITPAAPCDARRSATLCSPSMRKPRQQAATPRACGRPSVRASSCARVSRKPSPPASITRAAQVGTDSSSVVSASAANTRAGGLSASASMPRCVSSSAPPSSTTRFAASSDPEITVASAHTAICTSTGSSYSLIIFMRPSTPPSASARSAAAGAPATSMASASAPPLRDCVSPFLISSRHTRSKLASYMLTHTLLSAFMTAATALVAERRTLLSSFRHDSNKSSSPPAAMISAAASGLPSSSAHTATADCPRASGSFSSLIRDAMHPAS